MNAGQFFAQQEYRAAAMQHFPAMVQSFAAKKRIYRGAGKRDKPLLNTPLKCAIWKVIDTSAEPINLINIYELLPAKVMRGDKWKVDARNAVSLWCRRDWLHRIGRDRHYSYEVKRKI